MPDKNCGMDSPWYRFWCEIHRLAELINAQETDQADV